MECRITLVADSTDFEPDLGGRPLRWRALTNGSDLMPECRGPTINPNFNIARIGESRITCITWISYRSPIIVSIGILRFYPGASRRIAVGSEGADHLAIYVTQAYGGSEYEREGEIGPR